MHTIQRLMGHGHISSTLRYFHLADQPSGRHPFAPGVARASSAHDCRPCAHPRQARGGAAARVELADIVRAHAPALLASARLARVQRRACARSSAAAPPPSAARSRSAITVGRASYVYHSCRNRHCPKCQTLAKERWLAARRAELLPVPYFHLVFTLPHELNALAQGNPRAIYTMLFAAASQTLLEFGANPRWLGGEIAACLVLHTWGQPSPSTCTCTPRGRRRTRSRWAVAPPRRGFLFPVKALSTVFRAKFLACLCGAARQGRTELGRLHRRPRRPSRTRQLPRRASRQAHGWSTPSAPSPAPSRSSTTSAAT